MLNLPFAIPGQPKNSAPARTESSSSEISVYRNHLALCLCSFALVFSLRMLSILGFVYFARRHLMVWAIFAPKFAYESLFTIAADVLVLISYILFIFLGKGNEF